jgi:polyketide cyclase/dehydrase/lipid transport protein
MMDPDIHVTGYIPVAPTVVWEIFSDLSRWDRLDPAAVPRVPLDAGEWRPGFRVRVRIRAGRLPHFSRVFTMREVSIARKMTWSAWAIPFLFGVVIEYAFMPMGQGTRYTFNLMRRGPLGRLALPLLRNSQFEELVRLGTNLAREAGQLAVSRESVASAEPALTAPLPWPGRPEVPGSYSR